MNAKTNTIAARIATTDAQASLQAFAPLIAGTEAPKDWIIRIVSTTTPVLDEHGRTLRVKRMGESVVYGAPHAFTKFAKKMWLAHRMEMVGYAQALGAVNKAQELMELAQAVINTEMNKIRPEYQKGDHRPSIGVNVRLRSKHAAFEQAATAADELQALIQAQQEDAEFEGIELAEEAQAAMQDSFWKGQARNNGITSNKGSMAEDEGWVEVMLHKGEQLFDYQEPRDVAGAEGLAVEMLIQLDELKLPTEHPMYDALMKRLVEGWAAAGAYFPQSAEAELRKELGRLPTKEEINSRVYEMNADHAKKCAKRGFILTNGLLARNEDLRVGPTYARWAVNHANRRMWRDMQVIKNLIQSLDNQIDKVVKEEFDEERSGRPNPVWARTLANDEVIHNVVDSDERTWALAGWDVLTESTVTGNGERDWLSAHLAGDVAADTFVTAGQKEVALLRRVQEAAQSMVDQINGLYVEMRKVEEGLAPVWKLMSDDTSANPMPEQPPIYWNMQGAYLTEDEAQAALIAERSQDNTALLEVAAEKAGEHFAALLAGSQYKF